VRTRLIPQGSAARGLRPTGTPAARRERMDLLLASVPGLISFGLLIATLRLGRAPAP